MRVLVTQGEKPVCQLAAAFMDLFEAMQNTCVCLNLTLCIMGVYREKVRNTELHVHQRCVLFSSALLAASLQADTLL